MRVQLLYTEPGSGAAVRPQLEAPIAIGSDFGAMPSRLGEDRVSRITLNHGRIAPYHCLLVAVQGQLRLVDQNSPTGVRVNAVAQTAVFLQDGDRLQVGPCEIQVRFEAAPLAAAETAAVPETATPALVELLSPATIPPRPSSVTASRPNPGASQGCDRLVGFLFPRRCGRLSPTDCPHCDGGRVVDDPFFYYGERTIYPNYGNYTLGNWGSGSSSGENIDFTEADAASLEALGVDFEQDTGAS